MGPTIGWMDTIVVRVGSSLISNWCIIYNKTNDDGCFSNKESSALWSRDLHQLSFRLFQLLYVLQWHFLQVCHLPDWLGRTHRPCQVPVHCHSRPQVPGVEVPIANSQQTVRIRRRRGRDRREEDQSLHRPVWLQDRVHQGTDECESASLVWRRLWSILKFSNFLTRIKCLLWLRTQARPVEYM